MRDYKQPRWWEKDRDFTEGDLYAAFLAGVTLATMVSMTIVLLGP